MYQATVTTRDMNETYIGLTANQFKTRYRNHQMSFRHEKRKNETKLSKHLWQLKEEGKEFKIMWKILTKAKPYTNITKRNLCTTKKFFLITKPHMATLNKRNELVSTCRHRCAFKSRCERKLKRHARARAHNVQLSLAVYGGFNTFDPVTFSCVPGFNIVSSDPFDDSQLKVFKTTCSKMPHSGNILVSGCNVRAMLVCTSSYTVTGFTYMLLFTFYAGNYVNYIRCSAGNMLAYLKGFTGICTLDSVPKLSICFA